jgi:hypothetical protein
MSPVFGQEEENLSTIVLFTLLIGIITIQSYFKVRREQLVDCSMPRKKGINRLDFP